MPALHQVKKRKLTGVLRLWCKVTSGCIGGRNLLLLLKGAPPVCGGVIMVLCGIWEFATSLPSGTEPPVCELTDANPVVLGFESL